MLHAYLLHAYLLRACMLRPCMLHACLHVSLTLTVSAPPGTVGLGVGSVDADTGADLLSVAGFLVGTVRISCNLGGCGRRWGVWGQEGDACQIEG